MTRFADISAVEKIAGVELDAGFRAEHFEYPARPGILQPGDELRLLVKRAFITYLYVTDRDGRLVGVVVMREMILGDRAQRLEEIMLPDPFFLTPDMKLTDAMRAVPRSLREGSHGLGATKMTVALRVVFPAAISGIVASIVLAISRAVGETMIVVLAAGSSPQFPLNPVESIQAMTAYIATTATGDISTGSVDYKSVFAVGALDGTRNLHT